NRGVLPPLPGARRRTRPRPSRPLRARRRTRLARRLLRLLPASPADRRGAARGGRKPPRRPVSRALPDEPLPPGGLHGVALPPSDPARVLPRRAGALCRRRAGGGACDPDPGGRYRAPASARAPRVALTGPWPLLRRARDRAAHLPRLPARALAAGALAACVRPCGARPHLGAALLVGGPFWRNLGRAPGGSRRRSAARSRPGRTRLLA